MDSSEEQTHSEQLIHAAFSLGIEYERAATPEEVGQIADRLKNALDEVRSGSVLIAELEEFEYPVVVTLPRNVYNYLLETYANDPDIATTIRNVCISIYDNDQETPER